MKKAPKGKVPFIDYQGQRIGDSTLAVTFTSRSLGSHIQKKHDSELTRMITLYTTPPLWGLPSISPDCMKLETWLRIAKLPYKRVTEINLAQAPKGKVPYIDYQGQRIGDSTLIIEMFKEKEGIDLDRGLTASERAISLTFRRMLKENVYWGVIEIRYNLEKNWRVYREVIASMLLPGTPPKEWEPQIEQFGENIRNQMYGHGMGR